MGLYVIDCPQCRKPHQWFSGIASDQRCAECRAKAEADQSKLPGRWIIVSDTYQPDSGDTRKESGLKYSKWYHESAYDVLATELSLTKQDRDSWKRAHQTTQDAANKRLTELEQDHEDARARIAQLELDAATQRVLNDHAPLFQDLRVRELEEQVEKAEKLAGNLLMQGKTQFDKIKELESALNKIAILGSGPKAYTSDFTNEVMSIVRKALE